MSTKPRLCGSCKSAYDGQDDWSPAEADVYVQGKCPSDNQSGWTPFRGYLCHDHVEIKLQDGADFPVQRLLLGRDKY